MWNTEYVCPHSVRTQVMSNLKFGTLFPVLEKNNILTYCLAVTQALLLML